MAMVDIAAKDGDAFVVSAATEMSFDDGESFPTGYWGPEFAVPYRALPSATKQPASRFQSRSSRAAP